MSTIEDDLEQAAELNRQLELEDLQALLHTRAGQRFLRRLFDRSGIFAQTLVVGSPDQTAYNEGRRAVGLSVFNDMVDNFMAEFVQLLKVDPNGR